MSLESQQPVLNIQNLNYSYPGDIQALKEIQFQACQDERIGIVGPSGAGKSTLLMHLNGLLPASIPSAVSKDEKVSVSIKGKYVSEENIYQIRQWVGFLFQDPDDQLFCPTVEEDVAFGPLNLNLPQEEVRKRISDCLTLVGLENYHKRKTLQLSVGERKRVCLAGILACDPSILVLDEPTSNLDPRARRRLQGILENFDGCQIIATHNLEFVAEHCNRVILLDEGIIHADGDPDTILADKDLMKKHGLEVPLSIQWKMRS